MVFFNSAGWAKALGFSMCAFEGTGNILPIQDVTAKSPEAYKKIIFAVLCISLTVFLLMGYFCSIAWGTGMQSPIITD